MSLMKNFSFPTRLLVAIAFIGIVGMGINNAYADVPNIDAFVADDPDDGDTVLSDGDTLIITFSLPINATASGTITQTEIDANFTTGVATIGTTYSGVWSGDTLSLLITIIDAATGDLVVGTTTIGAAAGNNLGHAGDAATSTQLTGTPTLSGDFGLFVAVSTRSNGSGCDGDCEAPTLGINNDSVRRVENGFTYNGNTINVERYFTPYPLITVDVGKQNYAVFKIYDNLGPDNVRHFDLAFGLATGQVMGTSNVIISWDKSFAGTETISVVDPHNVLDNVRVLTFEGKCRADSAGNDCLIVTVVHTFRESLDFDMVGTNVWDYRRNAWQNFYNHGIHIEGQSLNPPDEYIGIQEGNLIHIFETGKNTAIDEAGNTWTFDKTWTMDYIPKGKISDGYTQHGIDRNNAWFNIYKQGQELLAKELLEQICPACSDESYAEINKIFAYEYSDATSRHEDTNLQNNIIHEILRTQQIFDQLFDVQNNY